MNRITTLAITSVAVLFVAACAESSPSPSASSTPAWLLPTEPSSAMSVAEAKASATEGATIVVRGRIGGRVEPITGESPVFTIVDLGLPHCGEIEGDQCPTPWDYCCETPEDIRASSATVQVVGASGAPLDTSLITGGLRPLDEVVVVGITGPRPSGDVLTIRATGVYRP